MNLLFTIGNLAPEGGGPSRTLPALCCALAGLGHRVEIVCGATARGQRSPLLPDASLVRSTVIPSDGKGLLQGLGRSPFRRAVEERARETGAAVIHDNGIWSPANHAVALAAKSVGVPRIVSVRGMLRPWAMARKRIKKALGWIAYQRRDLRSAKCLVATSEEEAAEIQAMKLGAPVAMVPHGVEVRPPRTSRRASGRRTMLFLGRLVPNKGLIDLVDAWARAKPEGWKVRIAGPDDDSHGAEVLSRARSAGIDGDFEFTGPLDEDAKWRALGEADLFVLPTHGENFGLAVAEALAAGVPVLTTRGAPWREIEQRRCGWWVERGADSLTASLRLAVCTPPEELLAMGRRGQELVRERHGWPDVAAKMILVYAWAAGAGPEPDGLLRNTSCASTKR